jgi:transposase
MSRKHLVYSPEFRHQMVELHLAGRTCNDLAREFGCGTSTIAKWVRQAGERPRSPIGSGNSPITTAAKTHTGALIQAEREELAKLRKRVKQLEIERDILSKATAWFANNGAATPTGSTRS